ncbi:CvpA family protein [Mucilaginibacter sp. UR6-11]|uniref:CvpA family protein n=1 Tax=Mucilaginibacter sp. UR6-11 TaxID=1435644 RepID=UPI001E531876|nr:CvpA family protein [Mucilaginibacter sp. UR6-11]MCC8424495.1 CvpA family protein [Mucilaginibacter sp. UR6-11]
MNIVDILIIMVVLVSIWTGYRRGFIVSGLILLSWVTTLVLALLLYKPISGMLLKVLPQTGVWSPALAFIITIIVAQAVIDGLIAWLLDRLPDRVTDSPLNRLAGTLPGLINGYIWAILIATFLVVYPLDNVFMRQARKSPLAKQLADDVGLINERLSPIFTDALLQLKGAGEATVSHDRMITLPFKVSAAHERPDLEARMLQLVNMERQQRGLQILKPDPQLTRVARDHSEDMLQRGYFSHYTPEGLDPFDRMKNGGVRFLTGGENIAITQTLPMAHTGLMNSPGHRANILNPAFGRLGIGILDAGVYGLMITQVFRN